MGLIGLAHHRLPPQPTEIRDDLSTKPADIGDTAGTRVEGNLKTAVSASCVIDERSASAVDPADIPEPPVLKKPLTLAAGNRTPEIEARADMDVYLQRLSLCRCRHRQHEAEGENKGRPHIFAHFFLHETEALKR
ncbi:MAG TPA: hypothetical protein VL202_12265 [Pararhizobium sp.]|uniref:hypothetical protein n=1 Tax=Pararhizobium sp. TaxID=1977563 RepID=UPI002BC0F239|nr:hypothetical protein [Pararhizobium sp.]HTO31936.1 hypothetical protein [Pararhizobium sp.]